MVDSGRKLALALGIHCHQPVGNFEDVVLRAVDECYLPFLQAAGRRPAFKFFAHFSGALLRRIESTRPEFIEALKSLAARGQIEILGGAMYEPILSALPDADRTGQIRRMGDYIQSLFGRRPTGLWLAERVWDPGLCRPLVESGISYVLLDDFHFSGLGLDPPAMQGCFLTEEAGRRICVFPISERLRYMIPYKPVDAVLAHLHSAAEKFPGTLLTYADDGEKFGLWPGTRHWQDRTRLDEFFDRMSSSDFLELTTPQTWLSNHAPHGPVYLPSSSYREMSEWALPAKLQEEFVKFKSEVDRHPRSDLRGQMIRCGVWKEFLLKYPESNWMHKRVSSALEKIGPVLEKLGAAREGREIRELLDRATCNDAYWHGVFGGIYMPYLRRAVFQNLLLAETRFSKKMGIPPTLTAEDLDADGRPEILVSTSTQVLAFKPSEGSGIVEWSLRAAAYNLQNTLTRRPEAYHAEVRREGRMDSALVYDRYRKMSGLVYALQPRVTFAQFKKQTLPELATAVGGYEWSEKNLETTFGIRFRRETAEIIFEKEVVIFKHESKLSIQAAVTPKHLQESGAHGAHIGAAVGLGLELFYASLKELSIRIGSWTAPGEKTYDLEGDVRGREMEITDRLSGTRFRAMTDREAGFFVVPSFTVTQTQAGYEKTFQGLSILVLGDAGGGEAKPTDSRLTVMVEFDQLEGRN